MGEQKVAPEKRNKSRTSGIKSSMSETSKVGSRSKKSENQKIWYIYIYIYIKDFLKKFCQTLNEIDFP